MRRGLLYARLSLVLAGYSLSDFYSFPIRGALAGCTVGTVDKVAWVESYTGKLSFWLSSSDRPANVRLPFDQPDAGLVVSNMQFHGSPSCTNLSFVMGPEADVNPLSSSIVPRAATWSFDLSSPVPNPPSKLSDSQLMGIFNGEPVFSGDGSSVISRHRTLFATKTGYIDAIATNPKYPTLVAFSNSRADHSFIGLYGEPTSGPVGPSRIVWVGPSIDYDGGMVWNADGSMLAWVRTYDLRANNGTKPFAKGDPYSIMVAEVAFNPSTGIAIVSNVRAVYTDWNFGYNDVAGFGNRALAWAGTGVVFGSEALPKAEGWLHVGWVDSTTGVLEDLTAVKTKEGEGCESRDFVVSADGQSVYVAHNCDLRESIGIVRIALSPLLREPRLVGSLDVAGGLGDDCTAMVPLSKGLYFLQSTYNNPLSLAYLAHSDDPSKIRVLTPPNATLYPAFNSSGFVKPKLVEFNSSDGKYVLHSQLFTPSNPNMNAILFTHGGSQRQMLPVFHFSGVYAQLYAVNQYLASLGYTVLSVNYRSGVAYGFDFRACEACGYTGGREYLDVLQAGKWLTTLPNIVRVGIHGLSYGGLNCLQALGRNPEVFAAGVANAPVFNWVSTDAGDEIYEPFTQLDGVFRQLPVGPDSDLTGPSWPESAKDNVQVAWDSSPVSHILNIRSPLLLIHGDNDEEVYFQESRGVMRALRRFLGPDKANSLVENLVIPDENHGLSLFEHQLDAAAALVNFFIRRLEK